MPRGLVTARETALNISASPIVKEIGELCFALYTPEGDSVALSTGIIVHVHTMSDAIKWMVRQGYEDNPQIRPGDIFANNDPTIGDVHNADVQTFVPIFDFTDPDRPELVAWAGGVIVLFVLWQPLWQPFVVLLGVLALFLNWWYRQKPSQDLRCRHMPQRQAQQPKVHHRSYPNQHA